MTARLSIKKYVSKMQLFAFEFSRALAFGIIKLPLNVDFSQNGASAVLFGEGLKGPSLNFCRLPAKKIFSFHVSDTPASAYTIARAFSFLGEHCYKTLCLMIHQTPSLGAKFSGASELFVHQLLNFDESFFNTS